MMELRDQSPGQCACGCEGEESRCSGLDFSPVRMSFEFTVPQMSSLKMLIEAGLYALREKHRRLVAMEPSWTIGADDLRMLREVTEKQIEEGHELLKRVLLHPASDLIKPQTDLN